jgi:mannosylglucosylglycerate synthase
MTGNIAILHYSAPPVVGGVEAVIHAHAGLLVQAGFRVSVVAGRGERQALPEGVQFVHIPEMDSQNPAVVGCSQELEGGRVPASFEGLSGHLENSLAPILAPFDHVIAHNLFTKHFNLPLTAALLRLLDKGSLPGCIAWCHDFTWTSPHSRSKVRPGYPWDTLRTVHPQVTYVTVSHSRKRELAGLFGLPPEQIRVIYNGVDPASLLGLSQPGAALIQRLGVWESDLVLLMPVRVTQAKNIEFALQVVAELKHQRIRATLVITGPPDPHDPSNMEYYRALLEKRRRWQLQEQVRFVYESGPETGQPYLIGPGILGELYRASDLLFMPSHREGFGMPVLEAGLVGLPAMSTEMPAALEIGGQEVVTFSSGAAPEEVSRLILAWMGSSRQLKLRRRIRREFTWPAILVRDILPLLKQTEEAQ